MRIGIFGGTFDPVHFGHLLLAETAREAASLDQVWFIPAWHSPFKESGPTASGKQRLEMLRLAIAGYPVFLASDIELKRQGTSYTVDTLQAVAALQPQAELVLVMGADSLHDFPRWSRPEEILELASVVAVNRGRREASLESVQRELGEEALPSFQLATMPAVDLSATDIRRRCGAGRSIRFQTPRAVEQYLLQHRPYPLLAEE